MSILDNKLALLELKKDPLFHLISSEKYNYYIENSIKIGKDSVMKYKDQNIRDLYKKENIKITINKKQNSFFNFKLRAEFIQEDNSNEVILHEEALNELMTAWNESSFSNIQLNINDLIEIHLAHEFYHYLEYNKLSPVEKKLEPIEVKTFFRKKKNRYIKQCSEIACHAFAKDFTGFAYFPTILDLVFLRQKGELDENVSYVIFGP